MWKLRSEARLKVCERHEKKSCGRFFPHCSFNEVFMCSFSLFFVFRHYFTQIPTPPRIKMIIKPVKWRVLSEET